MKLGLGRTEKIKFFKTVPILYESNSEWGDIHQCEISQDQRDRTRNSPPKLK